MLKLLWQSPTIDLQCTMYFKTLYNLKALLSLKLHIQGLKAEILGVFFWYALVQMKTQISWIIYYSVAMIFIPSLCNDTNETRSQRLRHTSSHRYGRKHCSRLVWWNHSYSLKRTIHFVLSFQRSTTGYGKLKSDYQHSISGIS